MKNILAFIVVLFVSVISVNAQQKLDINRRIVKNEQESTPIRRINDGATLDPITADYIERLGGKRHDEIMMSTFKETLDSIGQTIRVLDQTFWNARTIEGWHIGATLGASQDGGLGGVFFGYSEKKFDLDISVRFGQHKFEGKSKAEFASSAFVDFKPTIAKWGKNKLETNKVFAGLRVGGQSAISPDDIFVDNEDITFKRESDTKAFALAYGVVAGYERRFFMSPTRISIQAEAYTWNAKFKSDVKGEKFSSSERGFFIGVTASVKFVFQKKANNYSSSKIRR